MLSFVTLLRGLVLLLCLVIVAYLIVGIGWVQPPAILLSTPQEQTRLIVNNKERRCLSLAVWHATKGRVVTDDTRHLVLLTVLELADPDKSREGREMDVCTIFWKGLAEIPDSWWRNRTLKRHEWYVENVEVPFDGTLPFAERLVDAVESGREIPTIVREHCGDALPRKFTREKGSVWLTVDVGGVSELAKALRAELGEAVRTFQSDGLTFYCANR